MLSPEVTVALSPARGYRNLVEDARPVSWARALKRPAVVVLTLAIVIPLMAVHRVTLGLALTSAGAWAFAVIVEMAAAVVVIASAHSRKARLARCLDLWFAGHLPFTLWLLMLPPATALTGFAPLDLICITAVVPLIWTLPIMTAFCRIVLSATASGARWRAGLHHMAFVVVGSTLFILSAGGVQAVWSYILRWWSR